METDGETKKLILFYDDRKKSCCEYASQFSKRENTECRRASAYLNEVVLFAKEGRVGYIFESEHGEVPRSIRHVIRKLVADKQKPQFLLVTGGERELRAIHSAAKDIRQKGYEVGSVYSRYRIEKQRLNQAEAAEWICHELKNGQENASQEEPYKTLPKKELRRLFKKEAKEYLRYRRKMRKGEMEVKE